MEKARKAAALVGANGRQVALAVIGTFLVASILWILLTDTAFVWLGLDWLNVLVAAKLKAILYVLVVGGLMYFAAMRGIGRLEANQRREWMTAVELADRLAMAAEMRDGACVRHSERMASCAWVVALSCGLGERQAELIRRAAVLHDIGKIGVSDVILRKPGPLTLDEIEEMRSHVEIGSRLLAGCRYPLLKLGREIVETHHEAWDGTGYPRGLRGTEIPIAGRIVALCDVFDALVSERVYKHAWPLSVAVSEIRSLSGFRFDPEVVRAFDRALPEIRAIYNEEPELHPARSSLIRVPSWS